jgi:lactoylglutathione lyase
MSEQTSATGDFVLNQTMLRIKDPAKSVPFYEDVLGMTLLEKFDFPDMEFSLYFMGYPTESIPEDRTELAKWLTGEGPRSRM